MSRAAFTMASPTPEVVPQSGMREDQMNDTNDFVSYLRRHP